MATYNVPISQFPGGTAPASFEEFIQRVKDSGAIAKSVVDPELKYSDYGVSPSVDLYFSAALDPAEETEVDNLAAATPGADAVGVASYLANFEASSYVGREEDYSAATETSGGPSVRMDETYSLAGGRFEFEWHATVYGTAASTTYTARFIVDRSGANEFIVPLVGDGESEQVFSGSTQIVLPSGNVAVELEIERTGGSGDAGMKQSEFHYLFRGAS